MKLFNLAKIDYTFEGFKVHNPSLKELFEIFETENDLIFCLQILTMPLKETLKLTGNAQVTEFQLFQTLILTQKEIAQITAVHKMKIIKLLLLLFPESTLELFNDHFIFKKEDKIVLISGDNFDNFKDILSQMFDLKSIFASDKDKELGYNPYNKEAEKIAKKLEEGKKRLAELKNEGAHSLFENYLSVLSVGFGIPVTTLSETLTLYALIKTYKRFVAKIAWDMDIKCRLAGGTPSDSPDNWMTAD